MLEVSWRCMTRMNVASSLGSVEMVKVPMCSWCTWKLTLSPIRKPPVYSMQDWYSRGSFAHRYLIQEHIDWRGHRVGIANAQLELEVQVLHE